MEKEFNILEAEVEMKIMRTKRSQLYGMVKSKKESYQLSIKDKIREDNNHGTFISFIDVFFYDNEVEFRMSQYGTHAASIKFRFVRKDDINDYSCKNKEFALANNIELGDVYKFEGPGTGANLLEYVKTFNIVEYVDTLRYFAVQFEERGELVQMIKGFYLEYYVDMNIISKAETELSMLDYEIRKHYETLYTKEIIDEEYVKAGNVIVMHTKSTDFILFECYIFEKAGPINIEFVAQSLKFDHSYSFEKGDTRYYLKLENNRYFGSKNKRENIVKDLVAHKSKGDKVEIYTKQEFYDYCMLIETEKNSLVTIRDDEHYNALSSKYEEICHRK